MDKKGDRVRRKAEVASRVAYVRQVNACGPRDTGPSRVGIGGSSMRGWLVIDGSPFAEVSWPFVRSIFDSLEQQNVRLWLMHLVVFPAQALRSVSFQICQIVHAGVPA